MNKTKKCEVCGEIFVYKNKSQFCCSDICRKICRSNNYKKSLFKKQCDFCGVFYEGTRNSKNCQLCKRKRNSKYEKISVSICCRVCGDVMYVVERKKTKNCVKTIGSNCESCKNKAAKINSEKKIGSKNPNYKDGNSYKRVKTIISDSGELIKLETKNDNFVRKQKPYIKRKKIYTDEQILEKKIKREKTLAKMSERMKIHNPMFDEKSKEKASNTKKENFLKGNFVYKKGKEHHLWKGNRQNSNILRTDLTAWKQKHLKDSNYCCENCGNNNDLEVHHKHEPLREIIEKFSKKSLNEYENESDEFLELRETIKKYHDNVIGQVLCVECHAKIDKYRKPPIKKYEKDQKNN